MGRNLMELGYGVVAQRIGQTKRGLPCRDVPVVVGKGRELDTLGCLESDLVSHRAEVGVGKRPWNPGRYRAVVGAILLPGARGPANLGTEMRVKRLAVHPYGAALFWGAGVAVVLVLTLAAVVVSRGGDSVPSVPGVTPAQLAATKVVLRRPHGATPALASVASAARSTEARLRGWKLFGGVLANYHDSANGVSCTQCWVFDAVPPWGLYAVSGRSGPTQPCYQNDGVLTFFLVVVNAGSGQVVDLVGSNAKADGRPLPRGVRVACPRPPSPSS